MPNSADTGRVARTQRPSMAGALALFAFVLLVACDYPQGTLAVAAGSSPDASLRTMTLSGGASIAPAFDSATTSYTVAVAFATSSITVTPTATNSSATIAVNGVVVASGSASTSIALPVGTSIILVTVTAPDGTTTRTYTLTLVRART